MLILEGFWHLDRYLIIGDPIAGTLTVNIIINKINNTENKKLLILYTVNNLWKMHCIKYLEQFTRKIK